MFVNWAGFSLPLIFLLMKFNFNILSPYGGFDIPRKFEDNWDATTAAAINAMASTANGLMAVSESKSENRKNRRFQEEQNEKARQYTLDMWNKANAYNSPSAQRARMFEAGLNPYLAESAVNNTPTAQPVTPSHTATPNPSPQGFDLIGQGIGSFGTFLVQSANAANQRSQSISNIFRTAQEIAKNISPEEAERFLKLQMPFLKANGMADSVQAKMWNSELNTMQFNERIAGVKASIEEKFGKERAWTELENMHQAYVESTARVGLMASQSNYYNESASELKERAKKYASEIAANFANAYYWKEKGLTESDVRQYLVASVRYQAGMLGFDYDESEAEHAVNEGVRVQKHSKEWKSMRRGTAEWKESRSRQLLHEVEHALQTTPIPSRPRAAVKRGMTRTYTAGGYTDEYVYE